MNFIDLQAQYKRIKADVDARIQKVLEHGQFIMGPEVSELENNLAKFVGVKHCITCSSGSDALLLAMMSCNLKAGDEVIMPAFSFFATAEMPMLLGIKPVFVDIDPKTYLIDANLIENSITDKTKAIVPVSLYGQCADMDAINAIAKKYDLFVLEDAAQSLGAEYKDKKSGALSTIGCTSFFPSKPLGCYGDGGACFTDVDDLAQALKELRVHGQSGRYYHTRVGLTARLDTLQAAILLAKLTVFPTEVKLRQKVAERYNSALESKFTVPIIEKYNKSVYGQYTIRTEKRDDLQNYLKRFGIPTAIHYPTTLDQQPIIQSTYQYQHFESASLAAEQVLSLPFWPTMEEEQQERIIKCLMNF